MKKNKKDIKYYLNLPWTYTIETEKDNDEFIYIIRVNELPGVCTDASTISQGMELIKDAMEGALKLYIKQGEEIPEPMDEEEFQGNVAYRTSSRRHFLIAKEAQKKNVSLSKILDDLIDKALRNNSSCIIKHLLEFWK